MRYKYYNFSFLGMLLLTSCGLNPAIKLNDSARLDSKGAQADQIQTNQQSDSVNPNQNSSTTHNSVNNSSTMSDPLITKVPSENTEQNTQQAQSPDSKVAESQNTAETAVDVAEPTKTEVASVDVVDLPVAEESSAQQQVDTTSAVIDDATEEVALEETELAPTPIISSNPTKDVAIDSDTVEKEESLPSTGASGAVGEAELAEAQTSIISGVTQATSSENMSACAAATKSRVKDVALNSVFNSDDVIALTFSGNQKFDLSSTIQNFKFKGICIFTIGTSKASLIANFSVSNVFYIAGGNSTVSLTFVNVDGLSPMSYTYGNAKVKVLESALKN